MKKALALVLTTCLAGALSAGTGKLARELESPDFDSNVEVIVQHKTTPTEAHHQRVGKLGGRLHSKMDVAFISPNRPLPGMMDIPAQTVNAAAAATAGYDGAGIGVALIGSGISSMPDFQKGSLSYGVAGEDIHL